MECNKDEALRDKKIAEEKMVENDFEGARKFALKAKQLYPELDNISQLITVCDVHCAAQKKIYGAGKDLYGILQVENVADDTTICKQYRKLALVLHPDKNKFPGAEAAFKLIGEANMTLSDREKRSIYDMQCREPAKAFAKEIHNHQGNQTSYAGQQNQFKTAPSSQFNGSTSNPSTRLTFWTQCPFCSVKYESYREFFQRLSRCQQCSKLFIAYEIGPQAHNVNLGSKAQSVNSGSKPVSQQKEAAKVETAKGNIKKDGKVPSNLERKKTEGTRMKQEGVTKPKVSGVRKPMETGTAKATDKRMAAESRGEASSDKTEAAGGGVSGGSPNGKRSSRQRQQASYQEGGAGEFSPSKKSKLSKSSGDVAHADVSTPNGKLKQNGKEAEVVTPDSHSKNDPEPELVDCPEQDFTNFEKDKEERCFAVGQIWACYDSGDGMPRFYAQIRKVYSSKFRLQIAWFESDPDNALEIKWVEEGLPVACGKHELGETEETSNRLMFSHQMVIKKVSKSSYFISPQKGEIWAVYKDWDMKWSMDPENHTKYKFDIVEIVEAGEDCITVGFLLKVKGFVSVFQRSNWAGAGDHKIPCNERFRFSHRIPSAKLTGTERAGVPAGAFELDMASLPADFEDYCSYSSNNVNTASKSHEETVKPVPNLVSTPKKTEGTRMKQEGVTKPKVSGVRKPMETGTAKATDRRMAAESSEASSDKKEAAGGGVSGGSPNGKRSSQQRQQASYQEGGAGEFSPSKKSKLSKSSGNVAPADVSTPNGKLKQNGKEVVTPDSYSKNDPEPEFVDCPEQDFTNFDKDKEEHCFAVGQIWACYDSVDAMPRFYAQIRKVYSSKFRLQIAWFESDPDNPLEIKWVDEGLPVACGKHVLGETEETSNRLMFSHQMVIKKVSKSSYFISPQKGEIWAIYKDWDMKWSMDPENHTKYKFDIGEIVEAGEDCITVGFLLKVKGFVSVFQRSIRAGAGDHKIPCNERFRFSHRIPSAKLTGTERAGVPAGSFELDMASLPADFEDYCSYSSNNVNTASKSHEETVKPVPNLVSTPKKRIDKDSTPKLRRSPRGLGNQKI
ncbi:putative DnaJ domain, Chaperone J-domain superfamily [Helianthus annuus]|uniref:DnaJ domain, Chaperone J-domain superfamily n=1 Tax=Helianthus annuus TaxID=4232 RepID=A0A9K3I605_HELAN|nr:putative DnaJ domain, Chaperone J-domain superfamily [Helianthus annuus]